MKILTVLVSFVIAMAWLWGVYHLIITPMEMAVFIISIVLFAVIWYWTIRLEYTNSKHEEIWKKRFGYLFLSVHASYILFRILNLTPYENLAFLMLATFYFGWPIYGGYRLIADKVFG